MIRSIKKAFLFIADANRSEKWRLVEGILTKGVFSGYSFISGGGLYPVFFHDSEYWAVEYVDVPGRKEALGNIHRIDFKTGEVLETISVGFRNDVVLLTLLIKRVSEYMSITPLEACIQDDFLGRYDKTGKEYWYHPVDVAENAIRIAKKHGLSREEQLFCYLVGLHHDHIEDIPNGEECIRKNLFFLKLEETEKVITYVKILTRGKKQSYSDYFNDIMECPEVVVRCVKAADALHNSDVTRFPFLRRTKEIREMCRWYRKNHKKLIKTLKGEVNNG